MRSERATWRKSKLHQRLVLFCIFTAIELYGIFRSPRGAHAHNLRHLFSVHAAVPTLWNSLSTHIREIESLGAFKNMQKHISLG